MLYIYTQCHENIFDGLKVKEQTRVSYLKFKRGIIPQNVGGVTVYILCTSSGNALYLSNSALFLYQVLCTYLRRL